ncbi:hypothetical protein TWF506_003064 [Arthrobotrys conoides]|uniref:Uncharacterized protein n=1 Tax=Arthrobotrys conoides TaxID=74498 RepID=A0AAN8RRC2_9PEZI
MEKLNISGGMEAKENRGLGNLKSTQHRQWQRDSVLTNYPGSQTAPTTLLLKSQSSTPMDRVVAWLSQTDGSDPAQDDIPAQDDRPQARKRKRKLSNMSEASDDRL